MKKVCISGVVVLFYSQSDRRKSFLSTYKKDVLTIHIIGALLFIFNTCAPSHLYSFIYI